MLENIVQKLEIKELKSENVYSNLEKITNIPEIKTIENNGPKANFYLNNTATNKSTELSKEEMLHFFPDSNIKDSELIDKLTIKKTNKNEHNKYIETFSTNNTFIEFYKLLEEIEYMNFIDYTRIRDKKHLDFKIVKGSVKRYTRQPLPYY